MALFSSLYAQYYDAMYGGKDYAQESAYFEKILKKNRVKKGASILSFGAGTLNHEQFFAQRGYSVHGVELSHDMVVKAQTKITSQQLKNLTIEEGDMRTYTSSHRYDAVLIPFNVVSYCQGEKELMSTLSSASHLLKKKGVLVFDCWNARVMQKDAPRNTWEKILVEGGVLYKLVHATAVQKNNSFTRTLELVAVHGAHADTYSEQHTLFGWEPVRLRAFFSKINMKTAGIYEWMKMKPLTNTRWSMTVVAVKK